MIEVEGGSRATRKRRKRKRKSLIQLNPTPTDLCYRRNSVIANIGNKGKQIVGTKNRHLLYAGPLERGSTVCVKV